jgi:hypothetical protein
MRLAVVLAMLAGALAIAASIVFIGRWQMTAEAGSLYRLDRWTGAVEFCVPRQVDSEHYAIKCYRIAPPPPPPTFPPQVPPTGSEFFGNTTR